MPLRASTPTLSGEYRPRPFGRGRSCAAETDVPSRGAVADEGFAGCWSDALFTGRCRSHGFATVIRHPTSLHPARSPALGQLERVRAFAHHHSNTTSSIDFCNNDTLRGHTLSKVSVPRACLLECSRARCFNAHTRGRATGSTSEDMNRLEAASGRLDSHAT